MYTVFIILSNILIAPYSGVLFAYCSGAQCSTNNFEPVDISQPVDLQIVVTPNYISMSTKSKSQQKWTFFTSFDTIQPWTHSSYIVGGFARSWSTDSVLSTFSYLNISGIHVANE